MICEQLNQHINARIVYVYKLRNKYCCADLSETFVHRLLIRYRIQSECYLTIITAWTLR